MATLSAAARLAPSQIAHVLVSAALGFKQTAATPDDMRRLIGALLELSFGPG